MTPLRPLRIAFYAPLKSPDHPVPSGDRLMARMLVRCLREAGHEVSVASDLRAFMKDPQAVAGWEALKTAAGAERTRIAADWRREGVPDLWFSYHPYYKSPDLIGPPLATAFGLPVVTCEASWSARRNLGIWRDTQGLALQAVRQAALNLCLTARDRAGLQQAAPDAVLADFPPFLDPVPFAAPPAPDPGHLVAVAMMRAGDKMASYALLADALSLLPQSLPWHLSVAGDGPQRAEVQALFAGLPPWRITWAGQIDPSGVARLLARASVYVWPGTGEAYGLAYLEAQAAGVPVVAQAVAGVPEVVQDGVTGLLSPPGDAAALSAAVARLLQDAALRGQMAQAARARVLDRHSLAQATRALDAALRGVAGP